MVTTAKPTIAGFDAVVQNSAFKCAFISPGDQYAYGKVLQLKRHNDTDEVFVLLSGKAVLLTKEDDNSDYQTTLLQPKTAYNVAKGTWHHLAVSEDAVVFVTESGSMKKENTQCRNIEDENISL